MPPNATSLTLPRQPELPAETNERLAFLDDATQLMMRRLFLRGATDEEVRIHTGLTDEQIMLAVANVQELQAARVGGMRSHRIRTKAAALDFRDRMLHVLVGIAETETEWQEHETASGGTRVQRIGPSPAERISAAKAVWEFGGTGDSGQQRHEESVMGEVAPSASDAQSELAKKIAAAVAEAANRASAPVRTVEFVDVTPKDVSAGAPMTGGRIDEG